MIRVGGLEPPVAGGLLTIAPFPPGINFALHGMPVGNAPISRDSGKAQGARHIRGGRRRTRDMLYKAATAAIWWNPDMTALYDRLKASGKKHKVALVAVMRKLIILANVLLRNGREWAPKAPAKAVSS